MSKVFIVVNIAITMPVVAVFVEKKTFPLHNTTGHQLSVWLVDRQNPNAQMSLSKKAIVAPRESGTLFIPGLSMQFPGTYRIFVHVPGTTFTKSIDIQLQSLEDSITIPNLDVEIAAAPQKQQHGSFMVRNGTGRAVEIKLGYFIPYGELIQDWRLLQKDSTVQLTVPWIPESYMLFISVPHTKYSAVKQLDLNQSGEQITLDPITDQAIAEFND